MTLNNTDNYTDIELSLHQTNTCYDRKTFDMRKNGRITRSIQKINQNKHKWLSLEGNSIEANVYLNFFCCFLLHSSNLFIWKEREREMVSYSTYKPNAFNYGSENQKYYEQSEDASNIVWNEYVNLSWVVCVKAKWKEHKGKETKNIRVQ